MSRQRLGIGPGFAKALVPAVLGGASWEALGLPLGWLMGAAMVTGAFAMANVEAKVPRPLYCVSLATLGASVGLAITPDVATALVVWAPMMAIAATLGMLAAAVLAPILARYGRMERSTAFFALLPGGVIEMANIGERYGADRTIIAALHAVRVGLVVGLLPLALFAFADTGQPQTGTGPLLGWPQLAGTLLVGLAGGWLAERVGMPAAWLLGALIAVGLVSSAGLLAGQMPPVLLAAVQIFIGMSLGARFQRKALAAIPRALMAGLPVLISIMMFMALAAATASLVMPSSISTLVLGFSIGGMAEMVLTAKALGQNVALVAAFQAVRGVVVNALAGTFWRRFAKPQNPSDSTKG